MGKSPYKTIQAKQRKLQICMILSPTEVETQALSSREHHAERSAENEGTYSTDKMSGYQK